ncbi:MAG: hypothetical protein R2761_11095 [Acidimicrobiales bacterium]
MTIQLTTTHRRIAGALLGLWLGIHISILSGLPYLILGLPLLGALTFGVLDGSGKLLPRAVAVAVGLMTAEAVFTVVNILLGAVVATGIFLPFEMLMATRISVVLGRSIRMVPAAVPVPVASR